MRGRSMSMRWRETAAGCKDEGKEHEDEVERNCCRL